MEEVGCAAGGRSEKRSAIWRSASDRVPYRERSSVSNFRTLAICGGVSGYDHSPASGTRSHSDSSMEPTSSPRCATRASATCF